MKYLIMAGAALVLASSTSYSHAQIAGMNQNTPAVDITISVQEQKALRDFLSQGKVHMDIGDGTTHILVDATQILGFLNQKEQAAQSKTSSDTSPPTPARVPVSQRPLVPSPSPSASPAPSPSPSK